MDTVGPHIWKSEVRCYELDNQGIVNNAHYFNYFSQARVKYFSHIGIDWDRWHHDGLDLLLTHSEISFKASLRAHEQFSVLTEVACAGKVRLLFKQVIRRETDNKEIASSNNTVVCLNNSTGRVVMPQPLKLALESIAQSGS